MTEVLKLRFLALREDVSQFLTTALLHSEVCLEMLFLLRIKARSMKILLDRNSKAVVTW